METPEEAARRVFGARASFYTTSETHTDPEVLGRVVALCRPGPEDAVLDVGTGTGHTTFAVAPYARYVVGLDLTPQMLAEAERLKAMRAVAGVVFCVGDGHALPFADGVFAGVTCRRAAHHFSDVGRALREMRRVLRPGGRLVVDDRSVPEDDFVDALMNELDRYHDGSHVQQYRPSVWRALFEAAGFGVEVVEPYTQHRPLTSLTAGVPEADVRKIHARVEALDATQRAKLNLVEKDGTVFFNHWYVMVSGITKVH